MGNKVNLFSDWPPK